MLRQFSSKAQWADVVVCGGGLAGVMTAYYLGKRGVKRVVILDDRPPLSLTSSMSSECYRDFWPTATMRSFMKHSIGLIEQRSAETNNAFQLSRRGYVFLTGNDSGAQQLQKQASRYQNTGGVVREHKQFINQYPPCVDPVTTASLKTQPSSLPDGVDLITGKQAVRELFPFVDGEACLHARRAGWVSANTMGMEALEHSKDHFGVTTLRARVVGAQKEGHKINAVHAQTAQGQSITIPCGAVVNAGGPLLNQLHTILSSSSSSPSSSPVEKLPIHLELHAKVVFQDVHKVIPRSAPMMIWNDPQTLKWTDEEREALGDLFGKETQKRLTGPMPGGVHFRPYGPDSLLMLWECWHLPRHVPDPPPVVGAENIIFDELYAEVVLRGMCAMVPGLQRYIGDMPRHTVDGGYYTKTRENVPLVGPVKEVAENYVVCGALSGYGVMGSHGAGDLAAEWLCRGSSSSSSSSSSTSSPSSSTLTSTAQSWQSTPYQDFVQGLDPARYKDNAFLTKLNSLSEEDMGQI